MSQTSDEKMSPRLLNLYILFAFHCSLYSLCFVSWKFPWWLFDVSDTDFFSVRLFNLLACGKLIGGDWYLASILIFETVFWFLINVWCTNPPGNAGKERWHSLVFTAPMAGEDVGLLSSVPRHWRLPHVCTASSVLTAPSGLQGDWLILPSDFHQNISSFICPCTCYLLVLFEIIYLLFLFFYPCF